jgi:hypothetical protein
MAATELVTTIAGTYAGREVHEPTGKKGNTFNHVSEWLAGKQQAGIAVWDATPNVLVRGVKQWAAYIEPAGRDYILTIFEVT